MLPDLERLIELQEIESKATGASRGIAEAPGRIAALDALLHAATAALDTAKQSLAANKAARNIIDKDLAVAQQRQGKYKEQLMQVKTNDEFRAMQHQIDAAAVEIGAQEEKTLVSMMEADEINAAIKKAEAALKAAQAKVSSERAAIEQEVTSNQAVVEAMTAARAKLVASMDNKGVIDTFERIAKVRGTAVARAEGERCTLCQVRLRPAVFVNVLKNDQIVQCDSCQRILYFIAPSPPASPAPPAQSAQ
jgi:uncharacterized protein